MVAHFLFLGISYEYDELFTAATSDPSLSFAWIWKNWLIVDVHPPLHNFLLYVYNHFVPYGPEIWLRLPSLIFGFAALALAWYGFPKRFGKPARAVFVGIMATQVYLIFYSQCARAYSLILCLAVPLTFLFLNMSRAIVKKRQISNRQWGWYAVLSLLLCWSHYFGALLFGVFSLLLLGQAVAAKRRLTPFLLIPGIVFLLFLPWLLPNLWANLSLQRFSGAWWANTISNDSIVPGLVAFFFSSSEGHLVLMFLVAAGILSAYGVYKRRGVFPFGREMALLAGAWLLGLLIVGVLNFKIYLFMARYFMPFAPALYLFCALSVSFVLRRHVWGLIVFDLFLLITLFFCSYAYISAYFSGHFPAKQAMLYLKANPEKELFVVAMEGFPPAAMQAMYSFYPNRVLGLSRSVTELYNISPQEREKALARKEQALIWMPNCNVSKLNRLTKEWERSVAVEKTVGTSCFLKLTDKGETAPLDGWKKAEEKDLKKLSG